MAGKWLKLFSDAKRSKADFLIDGEEYYESVIHAIETATAQNHYIYILGWMLDIDFQLVKYNKDATLFNLLSKAASRGVEIRILIWDNVLPDSAKPNADAIERLNKLQNSKVFIDEHTFFPEKSKQVIKEIGPYVVKLINKIGDMLGGLKPDAQLELMRFEKDNTSLSLLLYRLLFYINRQTSGAHHEKVVIVKGKDGLIAFCGGMDFNKNRVISEVNKKEYRFPKLHDTACRLQGPAAHQVLQRFKRRWSYHPLAKAVSLSGQNEAEPKEEAEPSMYAKVVGTYNRPDGGEKDRSLKKAYFDIIDNAKTYIYIEDQYLVNVDVARAINKKLKDEGFRKVIFAIQDSIETADIFIPNRKRGEFIEAVRDGLTESQKKKVLLTLIDKKRWEKEHYHPAMHAKTLIVDDEIAIIGSGNVNQRSFTCDSETSVIVFNDTAKVEENFARGFRMQTWLHFMRMPIQPHIVKTWFEFPYLLDEYPDQDFSNLVKYTRDSQEDMDVRLAEYIHNCSFLPDVVHYLSGQDVPLTPASLSDAGIKNTFDRIWELVDPNGG